MKSGAVMGFLKGVAVTMQCEAGLEPNRAGELAANQQMNFTITLADCILDSFSEVLGLALYLFIDLPAKTAIPEKHRVSEGLHVHR